MRGGLTSHAAVVMRGMGKSAVTGITSLSIDREKKQLISKDSQRVVQEGEIITIDGSTGLVYTGEVPMVSSTSNEEFRTVLRWADKYKRLQVMANADTVEEANKAVEMGAEGIGLCRTEHMFFSEERLNLLRRLILADDKHERRVYLSRITPLQQQDFEHMFHTMVGRQVTIRLLDPPLHEFMPDPANPDFEEVVSDIATSIGRSEDECRRRILEIQEVNPMLGFRGVRLGIVHPEIIEMQIAAIIGNLTVCISTLTLTSSYFTKERR